MEIEIGPTGSTVIGDVLDVNKDSLESHIRLYDSQLYLIWNPKKQGGFGLWELRRRPDRKTVVDQGTYKGMHILSLEYVEKPLECHVFDLPVLNYSLLERIKKADMWVNANYEKGKQSRVTTWIDNLEKSEEKVKTDFEDKAYAELMYNMKQQKTALRAYREAILSGTNPADLAKAWK